MKTSLGHVEFIGDYEYYRSENGDLYRASVSKAVGQGGFRRGQFVICAAQADFALRMARLAAGLPEFEPGRSFSTSVKRDRAALNFDFARRMERLAAGLPEFES